jgi:hypothetical protein
MAGTKAGHDGGKRRGCKGVIALFNAPSVFLPATHTHARLRSVEAGTPLWLSIGAVLRKIVAVAIAPPR